MQNGSHTGTIKEPKYNSRSLLFLQITNVQHQNKGS